MAASVMNLASSSSLTSSFGANAGGIAAYSAPAPTVPAGTVRRAPQTTEAAQHDVRHNKNMTWVYLAAAAVALCVEAGMIASTLAPSFKDEFGTISQESWALIGLTSLRGLIMAGGLKIAAYLGARGVSDLIPEENGKRGNGSVARGWSLLGVALVFGVVMLNSVGGFADELGLNVATGGHLHQKLGEESTVFDVLGLSKDEAAKFQEPVYEEKTLFPGLNWLVNYTGLKYLYAPEARIADPLAAAAYKSTYQNYIGLVGTTTAAFAMASFMNEQARDAQKLKANGDRLGYGSYGDQGGVSQGDVPAQASGLLGSAVSLFNKYPLSSAAGALLAGAILGPVFLPMVAAVLPAFAGAATVAGIVGYGVPAVAGAMLAAFGMNAISKRNAAPKDEAAQEQEFIDTEWEEVGSGGRGQPGAITDQRRQPKPVARDDYDDGFGDGWGSEGDNAVVGGRNDGAAYAAALQQAGISTDILPAASAAGAVRQEVVGRRSREQLTDLLSNTPCEVGGDGEAGHAHKDCPYMGGYLRDKVLDAQGRAQMTSFDWALLTGLYLIASDPKARNATSNPNVLWIKDNLGEVGQAVQPILSGLSEFEKVKLKAAVLSIENTEIAQLTARQAEEGYEDEEEAAERPDQVGQPAALPAARAA